MTDAPPLSWGRALAVSGLALSLIVLTAGAAAAAAFAAALATVEPTGDDMGDGEFGASVFAAIGAAALVAVLVALIAGGLVVRTVARRLGRVDLSYRSAVLTLVGAAGTLVASWWLATVAAMTSSAGGAPIVAIGIALTATAALLRALARSTA